MPESAQEGSTVTMIRCLAILLVLSGLVLATCSARVMLPWAAGDNAVYTLTQLQMRLAEQPALLVGRTAVIGAMAIPCPWWGTSPRLQLCAGSRVVLVATPAEAPAKALPLIKMAPNPLVSIVGRLPFLSDLLPRIPAVPLFASARFHVRLLSLPNDVCALCRARYGALLLDATLDDG
jgi:hypothetical protein